MKNKEILEISRLKFIYDQEHDYKFLKIIVISCIFFGFLAHSFAFNNGFYNHDSTIISKENTNSFVQMGRFMFPLYVKLTGHIMTPFLSGILGLCFLIPSVYLLIKLFGIESKLFLIIFSGIFVTDQVWSTLQATYVFEVGSNSLGLLLGIFSIFVYYHCKFGFFLAMPILISAIAFGQSWMQSSVMLLLLLLIVELINKKPVKEVVQRGLNALLFFIVTLVLYGISWEVVLFVTKLDKSSYKGLDSILNFEISMLWELMKNTYLQPLNYFFAPYTYNSNLIGAVNLCVFIFILGLLLTIQIKRKLNSFGCILSYFILLILCPVASNFTYFIAQGQGGFNALGMTPVLFLYLLCMKLIQIDISEVQDQKINSNFICFVKKAFLIMLSYCIWCNILFSNHLYVYKDLQYSATLSMMTRIVDRIEETEGYVIGETPVLFIGLPSRNENFLIARPGFDHLKGRGVFGTGLVMYSRYNFYITNILGYKIQIGSESLALEYASKEEVTEMSKFPAQNSCQMIDGYLIAKIS